MERLTLNDNTVKLVWCTFQAAGFHAWPEAPEYWAYQRSSHRHLFHVRVDVFATRDGEVEFHYLKGLAQLHFCNLGRSRSKEMPQTYDFGSQSCEQLASKLFDRMGHHYDVACVTVSEDGECGATVSRGCSGGAVDEA